MVDFPSYKMVDLSQSFFGTVYQAYPQSFLGRNPIPQSQQGLVDHWIAIPPMYWRYGMHI